MCVSRRGGEGLEIAPGARVLTHELTGHRQSATQPTRQEERPVLAFLRSHSSSDLIARQTWHLSPDGKRFLK